MYVSKTAKTPQKRGKNGGLRAKLPARQKLEVNLNMEYITEYRVLLLPIFTRGFTGYILHNGGQTTAGSWTGGKILYFC